MMVANIPYAYTVEVGPHEQESYDDNDLYVGFHVHERKLPFIVQRAYQGIKEYLRTFVRRINKLDQLDVDRTCLDHYLDLTHNFYGYWGNGVTMKNDKIWFEKKKKVNSL
jgi:hypothetical protein